MQEANLTRVALLPLGDLAPGTMRRCVVPGSAALTAYNVDGTFYVTEDTCTHGLASLSEGTLDGEVIECPLHGGAFDVRTGEPAARPCVVSIRTFPVHVEDGMIYAELAPAGSA